MEDTPVKLLLNFIDGFMLVAPDSQIYPLWYILGAERTVNRYSCFQSFFVPVLMDDANAQIVLLIAFRFFENGLFVGE